MSKGETCSRKELRFVTSAEQMLPFLDRIRTVDQSNDDSDDQTASDTNDSIELNENNNNNDNDNNNHDDNNDNNVDVIKVSDNNNLTVPIAVAPKISASATSDALALPNIYEEYVNFIDLSVLNPIIDAKHCQRDTLIESEISEPNIV